jgi:hypothetical protein
MALLLFQIVRVRVAVVIDIVGDRSVGQIFDEESGQWAEVVWIELASSSTWPLEFGDVEFYAEVSSLALTRTGITRPSVRLRAWRSGGVIAEGYVVTFSGSSTINVGSLRAAGADLTTMLPALGPVLNTVRIRGFRDQRLGWSGRLPIAISWDGASLALRKRIRYGADAVYEQEYLSGVSGFAPDLGSLNAWLSSTLPEYGSALTVGVTVAFVRTITLGTSVTRTACTATFSIHASLATDGSTWVWTSRGALLTTVSREVVNQVCGGATLLLFTGDAVLPSAANAAVRGAAAHRFGTLAGSFVTPPAAGGTITVSPRGAFTNGGPSYGVDLTLTVTPAGRISQVAVVGITSDGAVTSVSAWGACKTEGGLLA